MANRTVKDAQTVKGTNPQYLIEKIVRSRIYESKYWKEHCFALTAELLVDKALELRFVGGHYGGNIKPTPFLCLVLKMLQIQPDKDIIIEFIKNDHKYVRALGAFYMRLTGTSLDCYKYLEPLLNDYRKIRMQNTNGEFELTHMDEFIDSLLREERVCNSILPRIQKRGVLEENNELDPRVSALDDDMDDVESSDEEGEVREEQTAKAKSPTPKRRSPQRARNRSPVRRRSRSRDRHERNDRDRDRNRQERDRPRRSRSRERKRPRSRSPKRRENRRHSRSRSRERGTGGNSRDQMEIDEANALRAKLGLAPLR